ncbi:putative U-box domain-containing protein 46 [Brassica napus]|nr:putative U-box domain-containing protein 46 [Brassica napus]
MTDSTTTTAADAVTLKREFKKILTEILSYGGESKDHGETGVLMKAIDEANRIINCLREVEPGTDILSPPSPEKVDVPREFKCTLSKKIMIEPVIIASGRTYEKRYIKEWLKRERTCPISNQVLSHVSLTPNLLVDELITQWCLVNKFERPKSSEEIVTELFTDGIDSLLQRISSPSSVADQAQAAEELRRQTKRFANVRAFLVSELPDSIKRLLTPLSAVDLNLELQENLITTLFNLSIVEKNKRIIAENPLVIPLLTKSLKQGTSETRRNSAATLLSLSAIESNRLIIGNSETLKALIGLIGEGGLFTTEAASAVFNICSVSENREKAVSSGLIPVLTNKIKEGSNVAELLALLALLSTHNRGVKEMNDLGFISDLLSILRKPSCPVTHENAVVIVFNMCDRNRDRSGRLKVLSEEENQYGTFTKLAKQGSDRAVRKAEAILKWLKRHGTGKAPQRG